MTMPMTPIDTTPIRVLFADDHPLFREALRHLLETDPDVRVEFRIAGQDYNTTKPAERIPVSRGRTVTTNPTPKFVTEGTLIIDMTSRPGELIWRGTYNDQEPSAPTLAKNLPGDAKKLLAAFPPR